MRGGELANDGIAIVGLAAIDVPEGRGSGQDADDAGGVKVLALHGRSLRKEIGATGKERVQSTVRGCSRAMPGDSPTIAPLHACYNVECPVH
jgi:hypothetical protein